MQPKLEQTGFQFNETVSLLEEEVQSPTKLVSPRRIKAMHIYKKAKRDQDEQPKELGKRRTLSILPLALGDREMREWQAKEGVKPKPLKQTSGGFKSTRNKSVSVKTSEQPLFGLVVKQLHKQASPLNGDLPAAISVIRPTQSSLREPNDSSVADTSKKQGDESVLNQDLTLLNEPKYSQLSQRALSKKKKTIREELADSVQP